jgi:F-type H+-transporting ATPase subunit a
VSIVLAAAEDFEPQKEFELHPWVPIELGPIDLSINKAVAYLWLGAALTVFIGIWTMRFGLSLRPARRQTTGESLYEEIQDRIVEGNLPHKAIGRWFPYVASLFLFIWLLNLTGFIPLPISDEHFTLLGLQIPTWGIYAATANLSVTLALALITFLATHVEGVRFNGVRRYLASFLPGGLPAFGPKTAVPLALMYVLEVVSQALRLVTLSVRLFANMLAGHMIILIILGFIFIFESAFVAFISVPAATILYIFEIGIVVTIQAFVFALLSAIYIGGAIEPEH